ncbi:hypothetical protein QFC21_002127 [Naganishia friedmannii]|uniref:Uncharacterized protein n=1 Tax=Naganishia friedmannii TaxID=89922 RepID=A0ACC2VZZ7_9TREE|nr:hypothetical protein QFC21_002127 [Naganishia friedmannii]
MAVVEDYIADSDDEDPAPSEQAYLPAKSYPPAPHVPAAKRTDTIDANIKGLPIQGLLERLSVPVAFQQAALEAQLSDEQVHTTRRRIASTLQEVADRLDIQRPADKATEGHKGKEERILDTKAYATITRFRAIYVTPDDALITPEMTSLANNILKSIKEPTEIARSILLDLKSIFSSNPHPEVSLDSGRRLIRPIGGDAGRSDMFEDQQWKGTWGVWNSLRWCIEVLPTQELVDNIPLILPPLLILMDDYEPSYRIRGLQILPSFLRIPTAVLHRTGIAQLLLRSIQHSISLHTTPPEPLLLEPSLTRLFELLHTLYPEGQGKEEEVAKNVEQAVEKGIVNGWAYSKSRKEGIASSVGVARAVELTFIPTLLSPLTIPSVPYIIPLQRANLRTLHTLLVTIEKTGRAARWRGEILNGVGILLVALSERGVQCGPNDGKLAEGTGTEQRTGKTGNNVAMQPEAGERQGVNRL